MEIPLKMIFLVCRDTVHGGALNNTKNDGAALRLHFYLSPGCKDGRDCSVAQMKCVDNDIHTSFLGNKSNIKFSSCVVQTDGTALN